MSGPVVVSGALPDLSRLAALLRRAAAMPIGASPRLGAGVVLLLSLLFSGPQGTLILAALAACPPAKCMSRDCCCGPRGNATGGCRVGPARCDPAAPFVLTAAKGVLPPPDVSLVAFDASDPVPAAAPVATSDGHGRRLDRPPRPSR
jgi:hypothetical protein